MKPQVFIDLDGVLADFDTAYENLFGVRPNQDTYEPPELWDNIRAHGSFYRNLPLMKDAWELWLGVKCNFHPDPVILTGIPWSIPDVANQKTLWVGQHFGIGTKIITCRSVDKCMYGHAGDILIDDRLKYSSRWMKIGGLFIHHTSARETLHLLSKLPQLGTP